MLSLSCLVSMYIIAKLFKESQLYYNIIIENQVACIVIKSRQLRKEKAIKAIKKRSNK